MPSPTRRCNVCAVVMPAFHPHPSLPPREGEGAHHFTAAGGLRAVRAFEPLTIVASRNAPAVGRPESAKMPPFSRTCATPSWHSSSRNTAARRSAASSASRRSRGASPWKAAGHQIVVVPSAMSGETNRLIALAQEIQPQPEPRELDVVASTGEQVTIGLLSMALRDLGVKAKSYTGAQVKVLTDSAFTKARIVSIDEDQLRADLADGVVPVVAGFQGVDAAGNLTTLGRGGSDTSAVALAAALKADECQIYTDVDGVYTTDPRIVPEARRLKTVTFEEMLEMASLGSKVLQIRSVEFAGKYKVRLRVLSSLDSRRPARAR